jgi:hypothetical protein
VDGIVNVIHNYEERRQAILDRREEYSWDNVAKILAKYYYNILKINEGYTSDRTRQLYINTYNNL